MIGLDLWAFFINSFKYRDRLTIVLEILKSVKKSKKGLRKTQIMEKARLNYVQTKKYLNYLLNMGYLAVTERNTYVITESGARLLAIKEIQQLRTIR
ncbi:hypothetical protein DRO54_00770 [Candidatus Bathyarchaeota archaeon]|nr:MAG: hypothetical protein DRO54_00770 [Candidatus Bathyarchaeota archaeon]